MPGTTEEESTVLGSRAEPTELPIGAETAR
jgi:hypothetical protein